MPASRCQVLTLEIAVQLGESSCEWIALAIAPDLQLNAECRRAVTEAEVHPSAADRVFALDGAAAVDDAVEKGHQDQMWRDLSVGGGAEEGLAVLSPEGEECGEEEGDIQLAGRGKPCRDNVR